VYISVGLKDRQWLFLYSTLPFSYMAICDPRKVRYPPEALIEAQNIASIATGGITVFQYRSDPNIMVLENIECQATALNDMRIAVDGAAEALKLRANARLPYTDEHTITLDRAAPKMEAKWSIDVSFATTAGTITDQWCRLNLTVRQPTILDKLRLGLGLTSDEQAISDRLGLEDKLAIGIAPRYKSLVTNYAEFANSQFDSIFMYANVLPAMVATSDTPVAPLLTPSIEEVWVLLGVWIDPTNLATVRNTYFVVDRDGDNAYQSLDVTALPTMAMVPCFIPFTQKLYCHIVSGAGSGGNTVPAGFVVGRRKATLIDHFRWGTYFTYRNDTNRASADTLMNKYSDQKLLDLVKSGML
jgi:hypothetical protein